jgi:flavin reductase (DIM6/NTAB) family NADH-FMN oxidoreductase RutF
MSVPQSEAGYFSGFYPMHLGLLSAGSNVMPIAWWTPISKEPFRILLAIDRGNHTLQLLREHGEAALHFFSYDDRERVVRAGYLSGRRVDKARRLGWRLRPAERLRHTAVIDGAAAVYELAPLRELDVAPGDHVPFVGDVAFVHRHRRPAAGRPLLFLGYRDFATLGDRSRAAAGGRFRPAAAATELPSPTAKGGSHG